MEKEEIIQNIVDFKKRVKDLQSELKAQNDQYQEQLKKKEQDDERRLRSKNKTAKFSSFEGAINRQPFINATHTKPTFQNEQIFIDNEVPAISATQKIALITPDRNKNPEFFTLKIDHPTSKQISEFPKLKNENMSEKEQTRLQKWTAIQEQNAQKEIEERNKQLIGSIKKQEVEKMEHKVFYPANTNLRLLNTKLSLISENPLTPRRLMKMTALPRLYEKKVWVPNNNYF